MEEYVVKQRTVYDVILDVLVFLAVLVVTIFLILDMAYKGRYAQLGSLNEIYFWVNIVVLFIFVLDLIRLYAESENCVEFCKKNWLDILATIPFGLIFYYFGGSYLGSAAMLVKSERVVKLARISKLSKASKVSKIGKEFKAASHLKNESEEYKKKHRL